MTVNEVIKLADEERPNDLSAAYKFGRIDRIEAEIAEMYGRYVMPEDLPEYTGIDETRGDAALLAPRGYTDVYKWWLLLGYDLASADTVRASNDSAMFNAEWARLAAWCAREHRARGPKNFII